ncbi:release factor glutamine methyltransferase [Caloramator fervidus]|uniref:Release factor glutamine methyltransferase n=1 Tax=Caloramator fervidus TaxID=29344 RepID=A0A1H5RL70_9CLOT|nr:peptide chain release factor N(5)-glutamine methyltransferase [Caloramator fervidus]SEF38854.1 release factor glutamine methyltransferase [Caloramator fervidus]
MKIFEILKKAKDELKKYNKPLNDAEILLAYMLKKDRTYIHAHMDLEVDDDFKNEFLNFINQRIKGRPLQYIIGEWEFYGLKFKVKEGVLIPRPDTEILVEKCLELLKNIPNPKVIDIGCGSGAISISIAKYKEDATVLALDIDDIPLEITKLNAKINGVSDRVIVKKSDILKNLGEEFLGKADIIVSNPPYIKEDEIESLMVEVKDFEPRLALSGGEDGLYFYRQISFQSKPYLKSGGFIAFEIGYNQAEDVKKILIDNGFDDIKIYKDLSGLDRVVIAKKVDNA